MHHVVFCFESDVYEVICHRGAVQIRICCIHRVQKDTAPIDQFK